MTGGADHHMWEGQSKDEWTEEGTCFHVFTWSYWYPFSYCPSSFDIFLDWLKNPVPNPMKMFLKPFQNVKASKSGQYINTSNSNNV